MALHRALPSHLFGVEDKGVKMKPEKALMVAGAVALGLPLLGALLLDTRAGGAQEFAGLLPIGVVAGFITLGVLAR